MPVAVAVGLGMLNAYLNTVHNKMALAASYYTPPSSITSDCSSDVTNALNSWFASLPSNSTVNLPTNACYLVSNSSSALLAIQNTSGLIVNGNGTKFKQNSYSCGTNHVTPVLGLYANSDLTISDITIDGPATCGGAANEGDYGIMVGSDTVGNNNVTFNSTTIENVDGDGLAVYPHLSTDQGINTNITFQNGTFSNIGYHGVTPEGVNGLKILNNTFKGVGNFMDLEVDNACTYTGPTSGCYNSNGDPKGSAQWNVSIIGNVFSSGRGGLWIESEQSQCIPQKNLIVKSNTLDSTVGLGIVLNGSSSPSCPPDSGLTITDNSSAAEGGSPCGGSIVQAPGCAMIEVGDYSNVTITNNTMTAWDGTATYYPNTIWIPCIALGAVTTATVSGNKCNNAWNAESTVGLQFPPSQGVADSNVTACNNIYWLTQPINGASANPKNDGACPIPPPSGGTTGTGSTNSGSSSPSKQGSQGASSATASGTATTQKPNQSSYDNNKNNGAISSRQHNSPATSQPASSSLPDTQSTSSGSILSRPIMKLILRSSMVIIALATGLFSYVVWRNNHTLSLHFKFGRQYGLKSSVVSDSMHSAINQNHEYGLHYNPGEVIRPDEKLTKH